MWTVRYNDAGLYLTLNMRNSVFGFSQLQVGEHVFNFVKPIQFCEFIRL